MLVKVKNKNGETEVYEVTFRKGNFPCKKVEHDTYGRKITTEWEERTMECMISTYTPNSAVDKSRIEVFGFVRCNYEDKYDEYKGKEMAFVKAVNIISRLFKYPSEEILDQIVEEVDKNLEYDYNLYIDRENLEYTKIKVKQEKEIKKAKKVSKKKK